MYKNLEAEMARHNISKKHVAEFLNVRYATVLDKLNGKYDFKLNEAFIIKKELFPNLDFEYLFQKECGTKQLN
ncbi:XRE family transcriptional regulator [Clostridium estertheticum]|uniref:XRE family transcriptional regulator n=1 Tax=Clostridium estertheticum TaxID=238834 RepID=UPI00124CC23A|nr:XRE family transcriptional regulator [Clostridium estertheticum]MBZ9615335.1 XRE family transcriptional regulator [Clostridium estertheticum subsp. laramiense]WAG75224.1 XRE family transcriptional regulator [Clostridium estertheticum]